MFGCFSLGSAEDGKTVNAIDFSETGCCSPSVLCPEKNPKQPYTLYGLDLF